MSSSVLRRAVVADAERMVAVTAEGFESYRSFAGAGWEPPSREEELARLHELLPDPDVWYLVAEHGGDLVGHVGFLAADRTWAPAGDPTLAHFRQLFVRSDHWGSGLATRLHAAAIAEAHIRGFTAMRLFTPTLQVRARRFYEREGWRLVPGSDASGPNGLEIVQYRRSL